MELIAQMLQAAREHGISPDTMSDEVYAQKRIDRFNAAVGHLDDGIDCPACRNKGVVYLLRDGVEYTRECECMAARKSKARVAASGLAKAMERCTFDTFLTLEPWQQTAKAKAMQYAENPRGWLLVCGQVGAGKTHLCTAVAGRLIASGHNLRYMLWRDDAVRLKAAVNRPEYAQMAEVYKRCDTLYIDDLFKIRQGGTVSDGDVNLAFEIINARYNADLRTIISTERTVAELLAIDEATSSRMIECAGDNIITINRDAKRNYRVNGRRSG